MDYSNGFSVHNPLHHEKESKLMIQQRLKKRKEREEVRKETWRLQQEESHHRLLHCKQASSKRKPWQQAAENLSASREIPQENLGQHRKDYNDAMKRMSLLSKRKEKTPLQATKPVPSLAHSSHDDIYHSSQFQVSDLVRPKIAAARRKVKHCVLPPITQKETAICRICQSDEDTLSNQLVTPCGCSGSLQYVHHTCLQQWRKTKKASGSNIAKCELCLKNYDIQLLGNSDVKPDQTKKMQEDLRRLVRSGVYLMLLVDFCRDSFENLIQERNGREAASIPVEITPTDSPPQTSMQTVGTVNQEGGESSEDNEEYVSRSALKRRSENVTRRK